MIDTNRLQSTFIKYVKIDSETGFEAEIAQELEKELDKLGFAVVTDKAGEAVGSQGGNIIATLKGDKDGEPLVLFAHMDTVIPGKGANPIIEDGIIKSDGTTVLGGDDKAAIAAMLEASACIVQNRLSHKTIQLVLTVREESGLLGAKGLDLKTLASNRALVLDAGGQVGTIVVAAPGRGLIEAEITGKKAHAGMNPKEGISAAQTAAIAVAGMKLLQVDHDTTANISTISCDSPVNIVPDYAVIKGEARSLGIHKLEAQLSDMRCCLEQACLKTGAKLVCKSEINHQGYEVSRQEPIVKDVAAACRDLGFPVTYVREGGCSDANVLRERGISALVLGIGMQQAHTTREWISIENLENTAKLVLHMATH
jgi:tripeptide aminopeptidase